MPLLVLGLIFMDVASYGVETHWKWRMGVDHSGIVRVWDNPFPMRLDSDTVRAVAGLGARNLVRPLLVALDDPARIAAAHVALM